ncbi:efflux RND transporter periplasmic adaptor subunit [Novipirellula artificiosorum]|uniref:Multidrug resistance protein MdtA n=1 Tax=Novipirellula artificiosorum TaxID=2528016 RepID=A0A5C6DIG7_9BACT|nr:efflux RND transporter periplasmic adaptor subunit [Novipirellula artificiosorum]TWU35874.1 Multidrug resistance protein MdtA precursor [Novipirellula artificiosorum]
MQLFLSSSSRANRVVFGLLSACIPFPALGQAPVPVRVVSVQTAETIQTTVQPATVMPYFSVEIHPRVSGYLKSIAVDIGDKVAEGDRLAEVAVPELERRAEVMQAEIDQRQAKQTQAMAGIELAQANVDAAEARIREAKSKQVAVEASVAAAQAEHDRTDDLVNRQSIQARLLDEARMRLDSQKAARSAADSSVVAAQADVQVAKAKLAQAEADLNAAKAETRVAEAELQELRVMIDYAVLKAPFDGVVSQRLANLGDLVGASAQSQNALFLVNQVSRVRIHTFVPEREAAGVDRGDALVCSFPAFPNETISATVTRTSGRIDEATRTMLVEAEWENADGKLIPGMFGQATIELSVHANAKTLPASSLRFSADGQPYVYRIDADGIVSRADVKIGDDDGSTIEVMEGLDINDQVIDAHLQRFVDGQQVVVIN